MIRINKQYTSLLARKLPEGWHDINQRGGGGGGVINVTLTQMCTNKLMPHAVAYHRWSSLQLWFYWRVWLWYIVIMCFERGHFGGGGMNLNLGSIHSFLFGRHHWTVYVETDGENEEFRLNRLDLFYPCQISTAVWVWSVGLFTKKTGNYLEQK